MSKGKALAALALVITLAILILGYQSRGQQLNELHEEVGGQKAAIATQASTIAYDKKSDAITDKVTAATAKDQQAIEKRFDKVVSDSTKVDQVIEAKYQKLLAAERAKTTDGKVSAAREAELADQKSNELSQARFEVLRQYLCEIDAEQSNCPQGVKP